MLGIVALLRIRQWAKNGFVLAPLFFGAGLLRTDAVQHALSAFAVFCLISSAIYIFNDWRDIEADRQHAKKRNRPLPSGQVSVPVALCVLMVLVALGIAIGLAAALPSGFFGILGLYAAINIGYSLGLKHITVLELFLVSSGFVLRLLAGGIALHVELSPWIMISTGMIALLLTTGKRRGDIACGNDSSLRRKSLESYNLAYLDSVLAALTGGTLVVYLLFSVSSYATIRYGQDIILTAIPVAIGLLRYLQLVMVYGDGDSPTDMVLKDKGLIAVILIFIAVFGTMVYFK